MVVVSLNLTDQQHAAARADAAQFGVSVEVRLLQMLAPALDDMTRQHWDRIWQARRRAIEASADLAAVVDAAGAVAR